VDVGILDLGKRYDGFAADERVVAALQLARAAELAGASRYWLAEHHVPDVALHAPEVILPLIAAATERLRVGAAGVLLRYYSPLKVWETYSTLAAAFGDRVDLGIVRGPGVADDRVARRLVSGNTLELAPTSFDDKVRELSRLATLGTDVRGLGSDEPAPTLWMLGSGPSSARLAAELGTAYGFMCFAPQAMSLAGKTLTELGHTRPRVVLALSVACADSSAAGHAMDERCVDRGLLRANAAGSVDECRETIMRLTSPLRPDEVVLACLSPRYDDQRELLPLVTAMVADR
jgi:luciferase family oxidoreductase group 1